MRRLPAPRAALCAASILVPSSPVRSLACSICQAGDPQFSASGSTALEPGSFSAYLEFQAWQKDSGLLAEEIGEEPEPGREVNDGRQLSLYLGYAPLDRVTLSLLLPWRWNEISEQPQGEPRESSRLQGFGDGTSTWATCCGAIAMCCPRRGSRRAASPKSAA